MSSPKTQLEEDFPLLDLSRCQSLEEGREDCWQTLLQALLEERATLQQQLQQALAQYQQLEAKYQQLTEKLVESEARNHALMEASTAQAQQFSTTLKQLRQNQAQVIQSEKMASLGQLVAGVAHEINNPVNFIHGNVGHVRDNTKDLLDLIALYQTEYPQLTPAISDKIEEIDLEFLQEDLPKLLSSMKLGTERIREIVKSLRIFSRLDEAEIKAVDLHEGIDSTLMILQHRLKAKSNRPAIHIIKEYGNLPQIECYAGQLNQVFMNVLVNAIDALEEDIMSDGWRIRNETHDQISMPTVTICTSVMNPKTVEISIIDNGAGMPESIQRRIFDPFFSTKPVGKGTGLGMSISYQIITEKHNGKLTCSSSLGKGTAFVIQIPIQQLPHQAA